MLPYALPQKHRVIDVSPKLRFGSDGEQDTNAEGMPLWTITTKLLWEDAEGDPTSQTIRISVPSRTEPAGFIGQQVIAKGLEIGTMSNGNTYFRAAEITPREAAK